MMSRQTLSSTSNGPHQFLIRTSSNLDHLRRGNISVLTAFLLVGLMGLVVFAIDIGYLTISRTESQRIADSCSLAAVAHLDSIINEGVVATSFAIGNAGMSGDPDGSIEIEIGQWDRGERQFCPGGLESNAVQIKVIRSSSHDNALKLFFADLIDHPFAEVQASAIAFRDLGLGAALTGVESLSVSDVQTDSFDSADGEYQAYCASQRGSLSSGGQLTLRQGIRIAGHAQGGKGHVVDLQCCRSDVLGHVGSRIKPLNLPAVRVAEVQDSNHNAVLSGAIDAARDLQIIRYVASADEIGAARLAVENLRIPAGVYFLNDVKIPNRATLTLEGPTTLYLTGDLRIEPGATINFESKLPSDFKILMTGGMVDIEGGRHFHGILYGPQTAVSLRGETVNPIHWHGAVVGRTLEAEQVFAHYDEAMDLSEVNLPKRIAIVD